MAPNIIMEASISFQRDSVRHAVLMGPALLPYLTPKKLPNLLRCQHEAFQRIPRPRSFPVTAILDVAGLCNLSCPYCPTGAGRDRGRRERLLSIDQVERFLAEVGKYLIFASLFNWGEPLLNPHLPKIVHLFKQHRIFTSVSTNLSLKRQDLLAALNEARLDHLMVSVSGASQGVYEKYHRRGKIDLVLDNLRFLQDWKRRRGVKKPLIEIKYLVFSYNRHEVRPAAQLAQNLGVDLFRRYPGNGPPEVEIHEYGSDFHPGRPPRYCNQLWHTAVLNADAGISPCCYTYFQRDDLGDFSRTSLKQIRLNDLSVQARSLFNPNLLNELPPDLKHPCLQCHLVHRQPHLQHYLANNPNAVEGHRTGGA